MSLRVWLPLNGNLRNNGLSNITVTNNGATIDNSGKIGKCYSFDGSNDKITLTNLPNPSNISVAFWMKRSANTGTRQFMFTAWNGVTCELTTSGNVHCYVAPNHGACDSTNAITIDDGWVHVVYTFEDKVCGKLYINGSLVKTTTSSNSISWNTTTGNLGYFSTYFNGKLNDFRIYDHILSANEVKELSKGLIVHYKLDSSNKGCDNILTNSTGYNGITNWSGVIEASNENGHPFLIARRTNTTSTSRTFVTHSAITSLVNSWATGTEFTISGYYKVPSNEDYNVTANLFIRWTHKSGESAYTDTGFSTPSNVEKDKWIRFENTYSVPSNYVDGAVNFYLSAFSKGLSTVYWKDIKLEKGDKATIWSPASSDAEYIKLGYDSNKIVDSSGYRNHGQVWKYDNNGNIQVSTITPRNSTATYINSENNTTNTASGTVYIYGNCELINPNYLTVAFWCKPIAGYNGGTNQGQICLTNNDIGNNACSDYQTSPLNHRDSIFDVCNASGTHKTVSISFIANEWHHYAYVYNGRNVITYKDGVQIATTDMGTNASLSNMKAIVLGFSKAGGVWRSNKSYYSDVRLYTTALSAEDVKELYNTPISISNNGSIFTQGEYVEV